MHGEPLKFYITKGAVPHAVHVPPSIPTYCRGKVMKGIVVLGVLEKVAPNTDSTLFHRMVITRKRNGESRRTADMLTGEC